MGWLLTILGLCRHTTMLRETIDGVPHFVCEACGYRVPILKRVK
jgi:hypothetical protein